MSMTVFAKKVWELIHEWQTQLLRLKPGIYSGWKWLFWIRITWSTLSHFISFVFRVSLKPFSSRPLPALRSAGIVYIYWWNEIYVLLVNSALLAIFKNTSFPSSISRSTLCFLWWPFLTTLSAPMLSTVRLAIYLPYLFCLLYICCWCQLQWESEISVDKLCFSLLHWCIAWFCWLMSKIVGHIFSSL